MSSSVPRYVLDPSDSRAFEQKCASLGLDDIALMENVAQSIGSLVHSEVKDDKLLVNFVVLVGPGNNGADGLAVLRYLITQGQAFWQRRGGVCAVIEWPGEKSAAHRTQSKLLGATGADFKRIALPQDLSALTHFLAHLSGKALFLDAIYGAGFQVRAPDPALAKVLPALLAAIHKARSRVFAVDVPSGLAANGEVSAEFADLTAEKTFCVIGPKFSQLEKSGAERSGRLLCLDLGLPYAPSGDAAVTRWIPKRKSAHVPWLKSHGVHFEKPKISAHKNSRGRVIVVGGSLATGAATKMAAETAMRFGAGYATIFEPPNTRFDAKTLLKSSGEWLVRRSPTTAAEWEEILNANDALVFGCGLPSGGIPLQERAQWDSFFKALEKAFRNPARLKAAVIDGGGLPTFMEWWKVSGKKHAKLPVICTPHPKEAADILKVFGQTAPAKRQDLFLAMRAQLAEIQLPGALLLKGAYPWISEINAAAPSVVLDIASAKLATAGSGDVLAGALAAIGAHAQAATPGTRALASLFLGLSAQAQSLKRLKLGSLASEISKAMAISHRELVNALES